MNEDGERYLNLLCKRILRIKTGVLEKGKECLAASFHASNDRRGDREVKSPLIGLSDATNDQDVVVSWNLLCFKSEYMF